MSKANVKEVKAKKETKANVQIIKIDPLKYAKAQKEVTKIGHVSRYLKHYPIVQEALEQIKKEKGIEYDEEKSAKENCSRLALLCIKQGVALSLSTLRDVLRCYFRDTRNTSKVLGEYLGTNTQEKAKVYSAFSFLAYKRLKKAKAQTPVKK